MRSSAKSGAATTFVLGVVAALLIGCQQPQRVAGYRIAAFTASWCGPCRADKPRLAEIGRYVEVVSFDEDADSSGAFNQFQIDALPTYIVLNDRGERVMRTGNIEDVAKAFGIP